MGDMGKSSRWTVGILFEDYLTCMVGCTIVTDYKWQKRCGDTELCTEIKYDRKLHKTGNLFFEYAECTSVGDEFHFCEFVSSGKCKYIAIGDCSRILLFDMDTFRTLMRSNSYHSVETGTSKGFLGKYEDMTPLAMQEFTWEIDPLFCEGKVFEKLNTYKRKDN